MELSLARGTILPFCIKTSAEFLVCKSADVRAHGGKHEEFKKYNNFA